MSWFSRLCRNVGLMMHNVRHPEDEGASMDRRMLRKDVEEEKRGNMTLRRTTIEEVEYSSDE